jgi:hypothetical protein
VHQIGEIGRIPAQLPLTPFSLRLWGDCACVSCLVRVPCALKRENETDQVVFDLRIADPRRVSVCVPLHVRCTRPERGWFVATTHTRITSQHVWNVQWCWHRGRILVIVVGAAIGVPRRWSDRRNRARLLHRSCIAGSCVLAARRQPAHSTRG